MKKFGLLGVACMLALSGWSVPAHRQWRFFSQSDGSSLKLSLAGDEYFHYEMTEDSIPLVLVGRDYYYARIQGDSLYTDTCYLAHNPSDRLSGERIYAAACQEEFRDRLSETYQNRIRRGVLRQAPLRSSRTALSAGPGGQVMPPPMIGKKKGLLILVNFQDVRMTLDQPLETFRRVMNEPGYKGHGQYGSVRDYFLAQSYGQFDFSFDVVGPVTVSRDMAYYGANVNGFDIRPDVMIREACRLADKEVNFKDYDWDGDGEAEQIFVVYAGYAESYGAPDHTIWPHQSYVSDINGWPLVLDGVRLGKYACSSELTGKSGTKMAGIGTMCHEFSHCFGLPDFYDVRGNNWGMSVWSLMDYGCYNNNACTPTGYTAYEKMMCGWLRPVALCEAQHIADMPALSDAPVAYYIRNDHYDGEYFLLENRQLRSWDSANYGHGLLVVHVDYDKRSWDRNEVNVQANRQRMTIVPADGRLELGMAGWKGDLYPGPYRVTEFSDATASSPLLHVPGPDGSHQLNKPVYNIVESNGMLSFDYLKKTSSGINPGAVSPESAELIYPVAVYDANGCFVGSLSSATDKKAWPAGWYILRDQNGLTEKWYQK